MTNNPKISIIIPVLNNLNGLIKSIKSIVDQTYNDFEVWIIDGESNKETQQYLKTLSAPFFWISEKDSGIYDAMNKGIEKSKGDWLYFLGSGDELANASVLQKISTQLGETESSLLSGKILYQGDTNPFIYSNSKRIKKPSWNAFMWIRNGLHHQGTFYKKQLFENRNYSLDYHIFADYFFNLYLYKKKIKCFLSDELIAKCTSDGVSKSGNWNIYKEEILLKTALTSILLKPFFYLMVVVKFCIRKIK